MSGCVFYIKMALSLWSTSGVLAGFSWRIEPMESMCHIKGFIRPAYTVGVGLSDNNHLTSRDSSSFLLQKTGCLSKPKQVLTARKIPGDLFVSSSQRKVKEIRTGCTQEGANASWQYCFFLWTSSGINHHWKILSKLRQLILSGYVFRDMPWYWLDRKCWADFKSY